MNDDIFTAPEIPAELSALADAIEEPPRSFRERFRFPLFVILILLIESALILMFEEFINKPPIRLAEKQPQLDVTLLPSLPPEYKMPPPPPPPPPPPAKKEQQQEKLEAMQSEKPHIAKKAEESKIFAKPVPQQGTMMAAPKKEDDSVAARLGNEPEDGVGSGAYSEFLHQWALSVSAIYNPPGGDNDDCTPMFNVAYMNGHVLGIEPMRSCGSGTEQAFLYAIEHAPRPPMPTSFGGQQIQIVFYGGHPRK